MGRCVNMRKLCVKYLEIALKRKEILTFLAWAGIMPNDYKKDMDYYEIVMKYCRFTMDHVESCRNHAETCRIMRESC